MNVQILQRHGIAIDNAAASPLCAARPLGDTWPSASLRHTGRMLVKDDTWAFSENFLVFKTIALSFLFDKHCPM